MGRYLISWLLILCFVQGVIGQGKTSREEYIAKYSDIAMQEMRRTGIPASITLAQGCLESDNGNSSLAVKGNNHFGIKCHDWTGPKMHHDDDEEDECFRKYRTARESYVDHSKFLTTKSRYESLFLLKPDDYKGWAHGLKKAGYATSNKYADLLIKIIEENELYAYDQQVMTGRMRADRRLDPVPRGTPVTANGRELFRNNGVEYIITSENDTYESLREDLALYPGEIYRYNDLERDMPLDSGMVIYLQPKKSKADRDNMVHIVQEGESMWGISQYYAIKLKKLYKLNNLEKGKEPEPGTELQLRRKVREEKVLKIREEGEEEEEPMEEVEFEFEGEF